MEKPKILTTPMACSTPAQLKRKNRKKSKWHRGTITKRRKISQARDGSQSTVHYRADSDTEEAGNTGESSEENEKEQDASGSKTEVGIHNSSTYSTENERKARKASACVEFRKDKIVCNGDISGSQIIISDENEAKDIRVLQMTRARRSQVEQQQLISVEKALAILSQSTPLLVVDHERLKNLLKTVVRKSEAYNIFQLENMYTVISQCTYQHRKDYNKTAFLRKTEQEVEDFNCSRS
ncbi:ATPase family AAA domain-containing protein 2 [Heterocephalus glaber]|uniref:ATPase family AAA domain-containing protein 2 n=1 Tax=Heterocephalus glaber TaxID=10181 RepID=G5BGU1_HETGA|nr:ATPase family AAA domain-containing protein 2 [Heterocephalus glaber]